MRSPHLRILYPETRQGMQCGGVRVSPSHACSGPLAIPVLASEQEGCAPRHRLRPSTRTRACGDAPSTCKRCRPLCRSGKTRHPAHPHTPRKYRCVQYRRGSPCPHMCTPLRPRPAGRAHPSRARQGPSGCGPGGSSMLLPTRNTFCICLPGSPVVFLSRVPHRCHLNPLLGKVCSG